MIDEKESIKDAITSSDCQNFPNKMENKCVSLRDLYIEKGHLEQLKRHLERITELKTETVNDIEICISEKIRKLEQEISQYRRPYEGLETK